MSAPAILRRPRGLALRAPGLLGPELALAALADRLFWRHGLGVSLPLFCAAVALAALRWRPGRLCLRRTALAGAGLLLALAPAANRLTALSAAVAILGTLEILRWDARRGPAPLRSRLAAAALVVAAGPAQMVRDLRRRRGLLDRRLGARADRLGPWIAWIAPIALLLVFTALLAAANPLIAGWIAGLPLPAWDALVAGLPRALLFLAVLATVWPLIRVRRRKTIPAPERAEADRGSSLVDLQPLAAVLLTPPAVLRALVLLVGLLALQLGLDGAFLWGVLALPEGTTYAAYAHRGAYPLVATALLAGAVALVIRRPGAPAPSRAVAALLALFLGENIVLVACAMRRLALYVAAYTLTEWRVAAFAWMGLVAVGLGLIAVAGATGRGARWLLRANALAALAALYGWCLLDVPRLVADYDVAHCAELKGEGPQLDVRALVALGPEAIPALDRYLLGFRPDVQRVEASYWRGRLAEEARAGMADWRGWTYSGWRLVRYLDTSGVAEPATQPVGDDF